MEDVDILAEMWCGQLEMEGIEPVWACSLQEGEEKFFANGQFDLIIMDSCVPGRVANSMDLVKTIKASGFDKPIVANSSLPDCLEAIYEAGATHKAYKNDVIKVVLSLLGQ